MTTSAQARGGEALAEALTAHGVTTVFSLAGTAHTYLLQALAAKGVDVVSTRHETATVLAADGYARASGLVGVALLKNDQGLPNAMTGICTANAACSPVVVLSSLSPASSIEAGGEHFELDIVKPVAKWVRVVPSPDRLAEYLAMAFHQAASGRPGVAVLGVPQEFQGFEVKAGEPVVHPRPRPPAIDPADAEALVARVAAAKRPMILAGGGALASGAGDVLNRLARRFAIPVLGNSHGRGLVPEDNVHGFSWPLAQVAARQADLVICAGIRLTQRMGYGLPPRFAKSAIFVQIDVHAGGVGRNRPVDLGIQADATAALEALESGLEARGFAGFGDTNWVREAMAARLARIDELGRDDDAEIHPYRIGRALEAMMPKDAVLVGDGADILNWLHGVYAVKGPRAYMDHYPFGSMGVGTGLALGAAAALRDEARASGRAPRRLVMLTGDGAFGFYCAELHSFARADLPITIIIANDGAWGTEHHGQLRALGESYNCLLGKSDYHHVGEAFGFASRKVEAAREVAPALEWAFAQPGRTLLNVLTDTDAGKVRKSDPRVQTIAFEDLASSLKTLSTPDVA
ncbi:MAG TPA: thiamine pyrophosphate-binding protein [Beijerinckiaceae bacterium]